MPRDHRAYAGESLKTKVNDVDVLRKSEVLEYLSMVSGWSPVIFGSGGMASDLSSSLVILAIVPVSLNHERFLSKTF